MGRKRIPQKAILWRALKKSIPVANYVSSPRTSCWHFLLSVLKSQRNKENTLRNPTNLEKLVRGFFYAECSNRNGWRRFSAASSRTHPEWRPYQEPARGRVCPGKLVRSDSCSGA